MVDIEIGDIFLNFMIHEDLMKFFVFDVTHVMSSDQYMEVW